MTEKDLKKFAEHGISESTAREQLARFATGFPFLKLEGSATLGHGILALTPTDEQAAIDRWQKYLADGGEVTKFVPASGAASRMFKKLFEFVNSDEKTPAEGSDVDVLVKNIKNVAFYKELEQACEKMYGVGIESLLADGHEKDIIRAIVSPEGLNYGSLPKALLTFHKYSDCHTRTPLEEQLAEGAQTAASNGVANIHFTVSADHRKLFEKKLEEAKKGMEDRFGVKFIVGLSEQKPSTDTLAATKENELFHDENGNPVFRPGGHGALIANLSDIDSAVVFVKNIDNVVPDKLRDLTIRYKKILGGELLLVHDRIERYLLMLREGLYAPDDLSEIVKFMREVLSTDSPLFDSLPEAELADYLMKKLNRPVRVCGMVRNDGEPGGGPFIAQNADGSSSPQILESTQIDPKNVDYSAMLAKATHFNPVDLVCYIKDIDGKPFDLAKYVDPQTGFISEKSLGGRELRALELPGLWNGAMSDWSTVFIQVPLETFNPVKTVNDLLRPAHQ